MDSFQKQKNPLQSNDQIPQKTQHIHKYESQSQHQATLKIISGLTGQDNTNLFLEAHSDQELGEDFAEFFLQK